MTSSTTPRAAGPDRPLAWWMRAVGVFYVVLGLGFLPPVNRARFDVLLPAFDAPRDSVAFEALIDWTFVFGLETAVIGAVLLWASRSAGRNVVLAWAVVALELTRGVAWDLYYLSRDYTDAVGFYVGFIVVHLVIAASGAVLARRAPG
ncbi:BphX family protein [Nocardioides coralli]|uniref:BphX family protein n=1 Tax=Nocardioides coralli TaxID=2872154 RepID=UPI001CA40D11|nr:BphX family protein [Nocardioides coralli]QZY28932.1 BphX family protein [Nocardioides coralli]